MDFLARWKQLWKGTIAPAAAVRASYERWHAGYSEPHRAYHTTRHIEDCLRVFDEVRHLAEDPRRVEVAIWWHDIVYDTSGKTDNERTSVEVARGHLEALGCDTEFQDWVGEAILATKHDRVVLDKDIQLVLDIDLHPLGLPSKKYNQHCIEIRREYAAVPWEQFAKKRAEILESFLRRDRLYYLPYFMERFQSQARINMRREIQFLQGSFNS